MCCLNLEVNGQVSADNFYTEISKLYYDSISLTQEPLYVGEMITLRVRSKSTHPYQGIRSWQSGSLEFGDAYYQDVSLLFNVETQRLILQPLALSKGGGVLVNLNKVPWFKVGDDFFRKSRFDLEDRYLHVLFEGTNFNLLSYRRKIVDTTPSGIVYVPKDEFYLEYRDKLQLIKDKSDLKKLFPDFKAVNLAVKNEDKKLKYSKYKEDLFVNYMKMFDAKLLD